MMSSENVTLRDIANAIQAILEDKVGEIPWKYATLGPVFPKRLTGFLFCDGFNYKNFTKNQREMEAVFGIQIIDPSAKNEDLTTNATKVEDYAVAVNKALNKEPQLDGWAVNSHIESVVFGTSAGRQYVGTALIKFVVEYENEE